MVGPGPSDGSNVMKKFQAPPNDYRACVGIVLINGLDQVFCGERLDSPGAWQMPQGGIDANESVPEAASRELREETGIISASLLAMSQTWRTYDLPAELARRLWAGRFRGQAQLWTLYAFSGEESEIRLDSGQPEFCRWKWASPKTLVEKIIPFKQPVYEDVFAEFMPRILSHWDRQALHN